MRIRGREEKIRIRTPSKLHKILESIFYPKFLDISQTLSYGCFIPFHKDLPPRITDTTLHLIVREKVLIVPELE